MNDQQDGPPRLREAFAAAQDLQSFTRALELLLSRGPLVHSQWEVVDHVVRAMTKMRELLSHKPTRAAIEEDHDGIALLIPLLFDVSLLELLEQLQRDRPQRPADSSDTDWPGSDTTSGFAGTVH